MRLYIQWEITFFFISKHAVLVALHTRGTYIYLHIPFFCPTVAVTYQVHSAHSYPHPKM